MQVTTCGQVPFSYCKRQLAANRIGLHFCSEALPPWEELQHRREPRSYLPDEFRFRRQRHRAFVSECHWWLSKKFGLDAHQQVLPDSVKGLHCLWVEVLDPCVITANDLQRATAVASISFGKLDLSDSRKMCYRGEPHVIDCSAHSEAFGLRHLELASDDAIKRAGAALNYRMTHCWCCRYYYYFATTKVTERGANENSSGASVHCLYYRGYLRHCLGTSTAVTIVTASRKEDAASTHAPFVINDSCKMPSLGPEMERLRAYRATLSASDCVIGSI